MRFVELFKKSVKDFKTNFKPIFLTFLYLSILPTIVISINNLLFTGSVMYDASKDLDINIPHLILTIILGLFSGILFLIALSGLTKASLKNKFTLREIINSGMKNWLKYLGLLIVLGIFLIGLSFLLIIPAIIFFVYWLLSSYVLFDEQKGILYSLKRSRKLIKGNWWKVFGYVILTGIGSGLVYIIFYLPSVLYLTNDQTIFQSLIYLFLSTIAQTIMAIIFYGFFTLFYKNLYLELKSHLKKEVKEKLKHEKKSFVWYATRLSFYLLVILFILSFFYDIFIDNIFTKFLILFVLIISITHLFLYRSKAIPILGIILSALISIILAILALIYFFTILDNQYSNSTYLINDSDILEADSYISYYFDLPSQSTISANLSSTELVDAYLLEESEFNRFADNITNETWYYLENGENVTSWNLTDYLIELGRYRVLIVNWDKNKDINYNILITQKTDLLKR